MSTKWTNSDGLVQYFGPRDVDGSGTTERPVAKKTNRSGLVQEIVVDFDFNHLGSAETAAPTEWWDQDSGGGTAPDAPSGIQAFIPAGSNLVSAKLFVKTAFATGDSGALKIGLYSNADQSTAAQVIDVDGIDSAIAVTAIDAVGDVIVCDGALATNDLVSATLNAYIGAHASTGGFTAGAARLVVEYIQPRPA